MTSPLFRLADELSQVFEVIARQSGSIQKLRDQRNDGTVGHTFHKNIQMPGTDLIRLHRCRILRRSATRFLFRCQPLSTRRFRRV